MRVLVVTAIRLYRDGVADALRQLPDVTLTHTAASGAEAVEQAHQDCDVALVDMTLPDSVGAVEAVLAAKPRVKVVALGVPEGGPEVVALAEAGIAGYVSREATLEELGDALRGALRGEAMCSGKVATELLRHIALQARSRRGDTVPRQLTPREHEVLRLLNTGMSNKQIARALDLQLSTVKNHVHSLIAKFGVTGRGEMPGVSAGRQSPAGSGSRTQIS